MVLDKGSLSHLEVHLDIKNEVIFRGHKADTQEVVDTDLLRIRFWGLNDVAKLVKTEALMADWPTTIGL